MIERSAEGVGVRLTRFLPEIRGTKTALCGALQSLQSRLINPQVRAADRPDGIAGVPDGVDAAARHPLAD